MCPIHHIGKSKARTGERLRLVTYRVNCFLWTFKNAGGPFAGFGFAADISETGAGVYVNLKLSKGSVVQLAFEDEQSTRYSGSVIWCRRYSMDQRFHGQTNLDYLVGMQLHFESEADRQRYLICYKDLRQRAAAVPSEFRF